MYLLLHGDWFNTPLSGCVISTYVRYHIYEAGIVVSPVPCWFRYVFGIICSCTGDTE